MLPSRSLTNTPGSVSDSQVYSLRILLVSDAALCICSSEDRTAATINYRTRTSMPQAALGNLPVCHQRIFLKRAFLRYQRLKYVLNGLLQTSNYSISVVDKQRRPVLCCDCAKVKRTHTGLDPETGLFSSQTQRGPSAVKGTRTGPTAKSDQPHLQSIINFASLTHADPHRNLPPGRE